MEPTPLPLTPAASGTAAYYAAAQLEANRNFIEAEVIAYIDNFIYQAATGANSYNQNNCRRDAGLIVDAIAQDILFGGTSQTDFAGLQYWNQSGYTGLITAELTQTIAAINYASQRAQYYLQAGGAPQSIISQVAADFSVITTILTEGTQGITNVIVPNGLDPLSVAATTAFNTLQFNKTNIENDVIAYINSTFPGFSYNISTCQRDLGYIIDSVSIDTQYGGNRQAVQSGVYYYSHSATSSAISPIELPRINAAYGYLSTLVSEIVQNQTVTTPKQLLVVQNTSLPAATSVEATTAINNVARLLDIVNNGPSGYTASPLPTAPVGNNTSNAYHAAALLEANREFIQAELIAYVNQLVNLENTSGFTYNQDKCYRDTGLIVDALTQDLLFEGTSQSNFAGLQYWGQSTYTGQIGSEVTTTTSAIVYVRDLAVKILNNDTTGPRYQGVAQQYTITTSASLVLQQKVYDEFNLIVDIIVNGIAGITDKIIPNTIDLDISVDAQTAYNLLENNKAYLQAEAVAYVDAIKSFGFTYDGAKCYRDIGYMVDSVAFDVVYGGYRQAIQSGAYYYNYAGNITVIPNEQVPVTAAYNYIKNLANYIITGKRLSTQYQTTVTQVISVNVGTSVEVSTVSGEVDVILNIINSGPSAAATPTPISLTASTSTNVVNAATLLAANRQFIQAETVAYINTVFGSTFNYNRNTCRRDVGYIIDSISFDLLRGGNRLWIRFFLLAVYATMYVRDHKRPMLHEAMGLKTDEYDYTVFRITTEISKQVFPLSLDTDHPKFRAGLERLFQISQANDQAKLQGGPIGLLKQGICVIQAAWTFGRLFMMSTHKHELPTHIRMQPSW